MEGGCGAWGWGNGEGGDIIGEKPLARRLCTRGRVYLLCSNLLQLVDWVVCYGVWVVLLAMGVLLLGTSLCTCEPIRWVGITRLVASAKAGVSI